MPRRKSIASIDAKISDLQKKAAAAKERYERLCRELLQLQQERELAMGQEILSAMKKWEKLPRDHDVSRVPIGLECNFRGKFR